MSTELSETSKRDFFYCYSPRMSEFIRAKGIKFICVGLNENSGKRFWQYERGAKLDAAISEWQANRPIKRG